MLAADWNHAVDSRYAFVANPESSLRIVDLQINPNTVAKTYRFLERYAVIETRGAKGSFIAFRNHLTLQVKL